MTRFLDEVSLIERLYARHLGVGGSLRLAQPRFVAQLRRMLIERISVVWDGARNAHEGWSREVTLHIDTQLIERRRGFQKRAESLSRIRDAADQLEARVAEIEQQDRQLRQQLERLGEVTRSLVNSAPGGVEVEASLHASEMRRARA
jgi:chromosome segregation ATPase